MKVFISSLISGMEATRTAAREAVEMLRGVAIMAEDFSAGANSPQVTCLTGLRQADLVLLILSEGYGMMQPSGLSATHEEYREAKGRKPVIAFVQRGIAAEPSQQAFIQEVQKWEGGLADSPTECWLGSGNPQCSMGIVLSDNQTSKCPVV